MATRKEQTTQKLVAEIKQRRQHKRSVEQWAADLATGDKRALSEAITLVESRLPADRKRAAELLKASFSQRVPSRRIGISGVPGAGKSTFIESIGTWLCQQGHKLAVLAIDPSSELGKGSILGDKTRMEQLTAQEHAFIRPSPTSGNLGGVARATREAIALCEAAGYNLILVETVGVGQNETAVASMVDVFLLIALAGAGDELQGIKRGITEMADIIAVNKADGENLPRAQAARQEMQRALHFLPEKASGWMPRVYTCSALKHEGMDVLWEAIEAYFESTRANGYLDSHRKSQLQQWLRTALQDEIWERFEANQAFREKVHQLECDVMEGRLPVSSALEALKEYFPL